MLPGQKFRSTALLTRNTQVGRSVKPFQILLDAKTVKGNMSGICFTLHGLIPTGGVRGTG